MIYLVLFLVHYVYSNRSMEYLQRFGYLNEEAKVDSIVPGVELFQETFNLTVDGTFNNETLTLMEKPRCGNKDELYPFSASPTRKWSTNVVTWYLYGIVQYSDIIDRAFNLWSKHANITFIKRRTDPMIHISFSATQHMCYSQRDTCKFDFDGPSGTLAHAYVPDLWTNQTDIHFDSAENWDFSMNLPDSQHISFYMTAVHEIGHSIGLSHSFLVSSVMWPYNQVPTGISDLYAYDIDLDDVNAVQFLYGKPLNNTLTTTSTTTSTTLPTTTTSTTTPKLNSNTVETTFKPDNDLSSLDICTLKNKFNHYLVFKDRLYVFHNKLVWILSLDQALRTSEEYTSPKLISDWLTFLPKDFTNITAIYQRPNDEIAIIIDQLVFYIQTPYLNLVRQTRVKSLVGRPVTKVNAAVSSNQGKTFYFIDDWYVVEINECSNRGTLLGMVSSTFPGIPSTVVGSFRYITGKLYFQTGTKVFEYDEFRSTVTRSIDEIFDFLGISCIRESLLTKLYQLIRNLK